MSCHITPRTRLPVSFHYVHCSAYLPGSLLFPPSHNLILVIKSEREGLFLFDYVALFLCIPSRSAIICLFCICLYFLEFSLSLILPVSFTLLQKAESCPFCNWVIFHRYESCFISTHLLVCISIATISWLLSIAVQWI